MSEQQNAEKVTPDPLCLQCDQARSTVRAERLFCCTLSIGEVIEVDQEWEHHRWRDWTDAELDRAGIRADAYAKHRRTNVCTLPWADCDDTKRGHIPGDEQAVGGMWIDHVGQCIACGQTPSIPPADQNGDDHA